MTATTARLDLRLDARDKSRIARAAALFDIRLLDHLIVAREGDFSFLREGLLK